MIRPILLVAAALLSALRPLHAQPAEPPFGSYAQFRDSISTLASLPDAGERGAKLTAFWDTLKAHGRIPFAHGTSVAFLYRGNPASVAFAGDFNGWNPGAAPAARLGASDVWLYETTLPQDARVDYKIVLGGSQWILDPANPRRQLSGFGPNSELRMPDYRPSPYVTRRPDVPAGALSAQHTIQSAALGYPVNYRVYTPPGYETLAELPVLYTTDGHEYAHAEMGSLTLVADNLLAEGLVRPLIVVFIDPRVNGQNRREQQYLMNPLFARFVSQELVPAVDAAYRTDPRREARAILGTSFGGLNSAYFAHEATAAFRLVAIQSPAFHPLNARILDLYRERPRVDARIHMTWGTVSDGGELSARMLEIMREKGYDVETFTVNEGHSWGNWRALLDDVLVHFWGTGRSTGQAEEPAAAPSGLKPAFPNPFRAQTRLPFTLAAPGRVRITVYDLLGRAVSTVADAHFPAGGHTAVWTPDGLPPGTYLCRIETDGRPAGTRLVTLVD